MIYSISSSANIMPLIVILSLSYDTELVMTGKSLSNDIVVILTNNKLAN